ncbi:MFS transporter [Sphingomonas mesophila]|uniref:MFS transporter n=1 Tax=Sphingomonas mesophila TaxID=2303576 RepID=UPI000E56A16A|nr:MFS transporter [Sphingomonas mesophila]
MQNSMHLLRTRRFVPIFLTQFLGAFNDNLFRTAMVMLVIYGIYRDPQQEATFSAIAGGLFILPFFVLSALAGQLADERDKAAIVRIVKTAEILIMLVGAAGLLLQNVPALLFALCAMGIHSTFFGPIKYAILPQHLRGDEVLAGTGLVEAGTYIGILGGTLLGGVLVLQNPDGSFHAKWAAVAVIAVAIVGRITGHFVPPAPPDPDAPPFHFDWHIVRASIRLVSATLHIPRLFLAIIAISFFWAMGAVLAAQFPPLVKNALGADQTVATLFLATFSVGVALGSVAINRLLGGEVSAKFAPAAAIAMGLFVLDLYRRVRVWPGEGPELRDLSTFLAMDGSWLIVFDLLGVAIAGGMFVVPLYAFLTTTVPKSETARTIAANNIVNSGLMVFATLVLTGAVMMGVTVADSLLIVAAASTLAAWLGWKLHLACD